MLALSFLIDSSSKLLVTRTGIKARTSSILGLWFAWPVYMFSEMRFDLGKLDSGERLLPFGLLVLLIDLRENFQILSVRRQNKKIKKLRSVEQKLFLIKNTCKIDIFYPKNREGRQK